MALEEVRDPVTHVWVLPHPCSSSVTQALLMTESLPKAEQCDTSITDLITLVLLFKVSTIMKAFSVRLRQPMQPALPTISMSLPVGVGLINGDLVLVV